MPAEVITLPIWAARGHAKEEGVTVIPTVAKAGYLWSGLSPFLLGTCDLYGGYVSKNMENAWQYSKVYPQHVKWSRGDPAFITNDYWKWAEEGWDDPRAVRYPIGRGKRPAFSYWDGECLSYVDARKVIYGPLYAQAVVNTLSYHLLHEKYQKQKAIVLLDYDVRDTRKTGESMTDVLNNPHKKMGHAFVLKMLLTNDPALKQMELR